jgi:hypothetical protein
MALITITEACAHLRIPEAPTDLDLAAKLAAAEAIVLDYLNLTADMQAITAAWTPETIPLQAKHAMLLELGELWRFRGDDDETPARWGPNETGGGDLDLAPPIVGLLRRLQPKVL